jgi:thioredoxin reductase (NADPH)
MGPEMMQHFRQQAARFGTEYITDDVTRVDFSERPFKVYVEDEEHLARTVIVATGATARQIGLESEKALHGRGVTYCATCDGAFYREREVVVVGGGDSAMEEALFLTKFASKVTIVHRRNVFRASPIMLDRARAHDKIEIMTPFVVDEVLGVESGKLTGVRLRNVETDETLDFDTDGLFVAIGHDPTTKLFVDWLDHDESGYLLTRGKSTETNIPGVYAAGDVQDFVYRQAITAAGSGCQAALDAERYLAELEGHPEDALISPREQGAPA